MMTENGLFALRRYFTRRKEEMKEYDIVRLKSLVVGLGKRIDRVDGA